METKEYRTHNKSKYGEGEWQQEPDKKQWKDEATGFPCLIVRNHFGALCGYVGVPEGHKFFGKNYNEVHDNQNIEVHGGLTFADKCQKYENQETGICHIDPTNANVWWLGFDCAHLYDYVPGIATTLRDFKNMRDNNPYQDEHTTYKNFEYVTNQVQQLAKQLKEAA